MKKIGIIFLISFLCVCLNSNAFALTKLYETSQKEVLNSGTNLTKYTRLTDKGWLSINIVDIDLDDENTSIKVLTSENGLNTFQNVKRMLENQKRCIAAVNADFFNGKTNNGNIIGMSVNDGEMLTSTYYENASKDVFGSMLIDENNDTWFGYFSNKITVNNYRTGEAISVGDMNKLPINYDFLVLYSDKWAETSIGSTPDLITTEFVIDNDKVVEVRTNEEPVEIPEGGYVLTAFGENATAKKDILRVGDRVSIDIEMQADVNKIKMAVSGGTLLVKEGQVANFTHNLMGSNPRTSIGVSKDGNTLYLITVDGRQSSSIGLTQTEFAELLIEKGIYNALNLDGGGSTTMAVRRLGEEDSTLVNKPSDGGLRNVADSVGVFNTDKTGSLSELVIEVKEVNVFVGDERELIVKGYDKYYNPVSIDTDDIKWSSTGVDVSVEGNVLKAGDTAGTATVKAKIGKATGTINIDVLSAPNELTISPKKVSIIDGEDVTFEVSGQNKNGYGASLKNDNLEWEIVEGEGSIEDGVFKSDGVGDTVISVSSGNATSYALIRVNENNAKLINDFEETNFYFKSYPTDIKGKVSLDDEEVYSGKKSAKLTYDFTKTNVTRAAYLRFDESVLLDSDARGVSVMVYATESTSDQIKMKLTDANGETQYLLLSKGLESNGWQELTLSLANVALPAKLVDIYVAQDDANALTKGSVYFDDLKIIYENSKVDADGMLPADIKGADELNVYSDLESANAFRLIVSPEFSDEKLLLDRFKNKTIEGVINQNADITVFPTQSNITLTDGVSKEKIFVNGYGVKNFKSATIISIDIYAGGIRLTDSNQWLSLQSDIRNGNKNILIVLNGNINDFKDTAEKKLFIDVLCDLMRSTGKNIWVLQKGDNTDYSMNRGIKYLSIATEEYVEPSVENIKDTNYIIITVNDNKMTYEIKNAYAN